MKISEFKIDKQHEGVRLESYLTEKGISKRLITKLKRIENGLLRNGEHIRTIDILHSGDVIQLHTEEKQNSLAPNSSLNIPIIYEDENLVVFNKPTGTPVHPSILHYDDTLGNYFSFLYPKLIFRPINRLDRDTSGLCIVAKNQLYASHLQKHIQKTYFAVACGRITGCGRIDAPIARVDNSIILRKVSPEGQRAVTNYSVIKYNEKYTLLKINLETGRTHQIRVHFAHIGHPLAGDEMYGGNCEDLQLQALHCGELMVTLIDGAKMEFKADIREDMKKLID